MASTSTRSYPPFSRHPHPFSDYGHTPAKWLVYCQGNATTYLFLAVQLSSPPLAAAHSLPVWLHQHQWQEKRLGDKSWKLNAPYDEFTYFLPPAYFCFIFLYVWTLLTLPEFNMKCAFNFNFNQLLEEVAHCISDSGITSFLSLSKQEDHSEE